MFLLKTFNGLLILLIVVLVQKCNGDSLYGVSYKWPTIGISILIRNKESSLPHFFTFLEQLDYPRDRLSVWIHSDYNEDSSLQIIDEWAKKHATKYKKVMLFLDQNTTGKKMDDQRDKKDWSPKRYLHIISLREKALKLARDSWADYVFMLDADVFLTEPNTLKELVKKNLVVVAPMLLSDGLYSNFWGGMSKDFYYKRSENYEDLIRHKTRGCFKVPMVHSAVLISLKHGESDNLSYNPENLKTPGPKDDIITLALSALENGIDMTVCNDLLYGFIPIPADEHTSEREVVSNVQLEALGRAIDLPVDPDLEKYVIYPKKTKYGLDEIFLINLEKRPERKNLMLKSFDILGIDALLVKAVDGKNMSKNDYGHITFLPNYEDPYHKRPMKLGEIGCFLSHHEIWNDIIHRDLRHSLILEDDIHFVPFFEERFNTMMEELVNLDWDLVYIGRKILLDKDEEFVTNHLTRPLYSYWTLGYLLSHAGAIKLINADPLNKMLPVDEFLPIMFDQHPNATWKSMFPLRNLNAFSVSPLLVHPTHYTGDDGYVSDTEDSGVAGQESPKRYLNEL